MQRRAVTLLQHNCRKTYAVTVAALEAVLELGVRLACLQEPYIDMELRHGMLVRSRMRSWGSEKRQPE